MTPDLKKLLIRHEGIILHVYPDSEGWWTIGVGRLIDERKGGGITKEEALYLLENDIGKCVAEARRAFNWFDGLDDIRQDVIVSLVFNMGIGKLLGFRKMLTAIALKDWETARTELLNSKWRTQVKEARAQELAEMLKIGKADG